MTPFELSLRKELDIERQHFVDKWLFPWHNINIPNRVVEVEDFRGGKFAAGGVAFQGQIQERYWGAIRRYLSERVHETIAKWDERTKPYPARLRRSSIDGTEILLRQFAAAIIKASTDTDRRLRGRGFPNNVPPYNASAEHSHANAEIFRLVEAQKALIDPATARRSSLQHIEAVLANFPVTITLLLGLAGLAVAALFP
jgi:hypothetical protein